MDLWFSSRPTSSPVTILRDLSSLQIYKIKWAKCKSFVSTMHFFFTMAQETLASQGVIITQPSRSPSDTPHSVGLLWKNDQPYAETSTWQHTTRRQTSMPQERFEPAIPGSKPPQNHAMDRATTGIGECTVCYGKSKSEHQKFCAALLSHTCICFSNALNMLCKCNTKKYRC